MAIKYEKLIPRFLGYVKQNTRSDENSTTIPSTERQTVFLKKLAAELEEIGLKDVKIRKVDSYLTAELPSNLDYNVPVLGLISHIDTADFNSEDIKPKIVENYDGKSVIKLDDAGEYTLDPKVFPSLTKYAGQTLITTSGDTLLGSDDKSGVAEIITTMEYLIAHPEIKHGKIKIGLGPDEEIGTGAKNFDVPDFGADFAYTVDGGPVGQLEYETFSAAGLKVHITGKDVHPSEAKGIMINSLTVAREFEDALPASEVPEQTDGRQGFFHLLEENGTVDHTDMSYIIRDFERDGLEARKNKVTEIVKQLNDKYGEGTVKIDMGDQYYNMIDVIKDHMDVVKIAEKAMKNLDIEPDEAPVRGGTDGSTISFKGLPTPNLFAGGENMHGRFEYVAEESMEKAVDVVLEIIKLNSENKK
ncbi:peptidase T [Companilactobacillus paralimentarius DSM 13238 = JCM 10415]|uniref:Peptidase T n=1 Tax=Companilactobacillus paralimentarius DSM 13238 = JCM 10415 TaxID=1122151 RepID=A0A0R1PEL3_9LACO|nr:peptidase T [Companilactobacillus paralimentarius]KAE9564677.1 peptidase T [Companilactobacillus paralimentarius]KRL30928.1 peptidase T [Companilactobacillus paralimentarius DSM 13238 = JCM 10415]MDR4934031.1 peptidase T [Companilactobacillus paralimentarius]